MIIGLTGKKRSGKDTAADYFVDQGFVEYHFADPIKRLCKDVFMWSDEWVNGDDKETVDPRWGISPREAMQLVGTELFRKAMPYYSKGFAKTTRDAIWIKRFIEEFEDYEGDVVIPDVRFVNEAKAIQELGGYIIKIERDGLESTDKHSSETELDKIDADSVVLNNGTIEDLIGEMAYIHAKISL